MHASNKKVEEPCSNTAMCSGGGAGGVGGAGGAGQAAGGVGGGQGVVPGQFAVSIDCFNTASICLKSSSKSNI